MTTLSAVIRENARSAPDAIALICEDRRVNYRQLLDRSLRLASLLVERGIGKGDRVAWIGQNSGHWLELLIASAHVGAIFCSLNWRLSVAEQCAMLDYVDPHLMVWQQQDVGATGVALRDQRPQSAWIAHDDPSVDGLEALIAAAAPFEPEADPGDPDLPVLLLPVAHPAGSPLASLLSHRNLLVAAPLMAQLQDIDRSTVNLAAAPLFHVAAFFTLIPTLLMRGTNVMVARSDPERLCREIAAHRCTHGFLLAPTAEGMIEANAAGRYELGSFRSSLRIDRWRSMVADDESRWGRSPGGFGQTETGMAVLAALGEGASMTSGWAAPYCEVRIVDGDGRTALPGQTGEIIVRGQNVHLGYWRAATLTRARFTDGWWHTGDLGARAADGQISFVGPKGRMIKSGAENIYGSEVELCLARHPAVSEAGVIGVPDATWIQTVRAIVVLAEGAATTEAQLQDFVRDALASYKKPRSIVFRREPLPRSGPAIDYARLDAEYGGGGYPGEGTRSA